MKTISHDKPTSQLPCQRNPDAWFTYDGHDIHHSEHARLGCLLDCPLDEHRRCAARALHVKAEYGVWAGIRLPGGQYRKRFELKACHETLGRIAHGEIYSHQLPANAQLLAGEQREAS